MSTDSAGGSPIQRFGARMSSVVERVMPSPFLFAILLSYVVFVGAVVVEGASPFALVGYWYDGFWVLLDFAMQMVLILVTGYALAYHPVVRGGIEWLTSLPNDGKQAAVLVGVISMTVAWVHWGLGLIVGAVMAREMGRQAAKTNLQVHYPLLCLAGYMGMGLTWHWGLAGSAPLLMNTPGNVFVEQGIVEGLIPTSETVFHPYTLTLVVTGILYTSVVLYLLAPERSNAQPITEYVPESELFGASADGGDATGTDATGADSNPTTTGEKINQSRVVGGIIALTGVVFAGYTFATQGLSALNLNLVNFLFLFLGLALYTRPKAYQEQFYEAISSTGGIVLQFPLYAGIIGMMNNSGLSETMAEALVSLSTPATFPAVAWITAGVVNVFVPSGGGEWTVIGTTVLQAANELGVPAGQATVAYAVGDAHTNLLQPFWALPLLGITGMRARDMFGYGVTMMLLLIPFLAVGLIFIPY
ncbi:TIGR00366 family protein [Halogeometricum sp. S1BR25-6]|uniref:TIGR00366 family protein n=1 Tax=Halogeometricum salsisoli TaxID=2950536 RepID=A0ABU2GFC0_9EURY|nr:TIGR00366 family protein [Halogeometricum sp. S1BR25-6]MDS0298899.1 TIGR00366 family protein [Halogeometricum sp. S1BR25-6]